MSEHEYAACPTCGRNRVIKTHNKMQTNEYGSSTVIKEGAKIRWDFVTDLGAFEFIQVRSGGGKVAGVGKGYRGSAPGIGFKLVRSFTLVEVMDDPKYSDVVQGLRDQLVLLVKDGIRLRTY